jgi:2OG-Fe(II) oxygenase superfamily
MAEESMIAWRQLSESPLTPSGLAALFSNQIPAIRISEFASLEECESLANIIQHRTMDPYKDVDPPIGRIGITQFECRDDEKSRYFGCVAQAESIRKAIVSSTFDPLERLVELFRHNGLDLKRAIEPGFGPYFAGAIRRINNCALLHVDLSSSDAQGWEVGRVRSQLAWNLYLRAGQEGGECVVYNRQWCEGDEKFRLRGSYGYDPTITAGVELLSLSPVAGDVVLFNCRNFHEVRSTVGDRITMGSFIGQTIDGRLIAWS